MPGLILKLRAHEQILVNGVVMQNGERTARLIVKTPNAHILRLRDAIHPDEVDTPVKRVCYIAQLAVAGEVDAEEAASQLSRGIAQLQDALSGLKEAEHLDTAVEALRKRNFYAVLKALRRVLPVEAMLLARFRAPADGGGSPSVPASATGEAPRTAATTEPSAGLQPSGQGPSARAGASGQATGVLDGAGAGATDPPPGCLGAGRAPTDSNGGARQWPSHR